jgi:hypothetical protein
MNQYSLTFFSLVAISPYILYTSDTNSLNQLTSQSSTLVVNNQDNQLENQHNNNYIQKSIIKTIPISEKDIPTFNPLYNNIDKVKLLQPIDTVDFLLESTQYIYTDNGKTIKLKKETHLKNITTSIKKSSKKNEKSNEELKKIISIFKNRYNLSSLLNQSKKIKK